MDERFERCLREKRLVKAKPEKDLIIKEIAAAESDLKSAYDSADDKDFKWATIQAYYSMFHTAKALVLSKGYREKGHMCLSIALKALLTDEGNLEEKHYSRYRDAMVLREDADYGLIYSEDSSKGAIGWAQDFLNEAKNLLKKN